MKYLKLLIILLLLSLTSLLSLAQDGEGQVCVRSFEDRNDNATFDANEPFITQGVGVNLMNALGVTIDAKLLDDSPIAAQGMVCFQQLPIGDYTVIVTSADYSAVTLTSFNALVIPGSVPVRFDFGGKLISADVGTNVSANNATATVTSQSNVLQGMLFGVLGAIVVMGILTIIGMSIYFGVFRQRLKRIVASQGTGSYRPVTGPMPAYQQPGTGSMPAYRQTPPPTTGSMPPVEANNPLLTRDPNEGSPPLFRDEDTDQMGTVKE